jgi:hypothetical protein
LIARLFANDHDGRSRCTCAEHGLRGGFPQTTAPTAGRVAAGGAQGASPGRPHFPGRVMRGLDGRRSDGLRALPRTSCHTLSGISRNTLQNPSPNGVVVIRSTATDSCTFQDRQRRLATACQRVGSDFPRNARTWSSRRTTPGAMGLHI